MSSLITYEVSTKSLEVDWEYTVIMLRWHHNGLYEFLSLPSLFTASKSWQVFAA